MRVCVFVAGLHHSVKCLSYWAHGPKSLKATVTSASKGYSGALAEGQIKVDLGL